MKMRHLSVWLLSACILAMPVWAEPIPEPAESDARYYIELPKGGAEAFFRYTPNRIPLISHHRAGPVLGYPENAIETMDNALRYGFGLMEVDVAELKDGGLVLMHDDTLDRTTTGTGAIKDKTSAEIARLKLVDYEGRVTDYTVPTLEAALKWARGKTILTLDIKRGTDFGKVAEAVRATGAEDYAVIITYSLAQATAFHQIAPELMLTVSVYDEDGIDALVQSGINPLKIIAWTGTSLKEPAFYTALHAKGWRVISGTFSLDDKLAVSGDNGEYMAVYASGVDVIATDRFWAVQAQIRNPNLFYFVRRAAN